MLGKDLPLVAFLSAPLNTDFLMNSSRTFTIGLGFVTTTWVTLRLHASCRPRGQCSVLLPGIRDNDKTPKESVAFSSGIMVSVITHKQ